MHFSRQVWSKNSDISRNLDGNDVGERDATVGVTQRLGQRDRVAASGGAVDADQHVLERGRLVRVVGHRNELFDVSFCLCELRGLSSLSPS